MMTGVSGIAVALPACIFGQLSTVTTWLILNDLFVTPHTTPVWHFVIDFLLAVTTLLVLNHTGRKMEAVDRANEAPYASNKTTMCGDDGSGELDPLVGGDDSGAILYNL